MNTVRSKLAAASKHGEHIDRLDERELALRRIAGRTGFRLCMDWERYLIQTQALGSRPIDIAIHGRFCFLDFLPAQLTASRLPDQAETGASSASTCNHSSCPESSSKARESGEGRHSAINQRAIMPFRRNHCL